MPTLTVFSTTTPSRGAVTVNDASPAETRSELSFCCARLTARSASLTCCFAVTSSLAASDPASTRRCTRSRLSRAVSRSTIALARSLWSSARFGLATVNSGAPVFTSWPRSTITCVTRPASGEPMRDVLASSNWMRAGTASVQCGSAISVGASLTTLHIGASLASVTESEPTVMPGASGSFGGSGRL